ncbi:aromatic amino acid lyase, partial [uncultured Cloacibacillus sp.]
MALAGAIEDHANNTPLVVQKLRKAIDNMKYIYGMEMMHACQAVELRKRGQELELGRGTKIAFSEFRKELKLYESDRPLSPDIRKAYEFIDGGVLLKEVRDKFL